MNAKDKIYLLFKKREELEVVEIKRELGFDWNTIRTTLLRLQLERCIKEIKFSQVSTT